MRACPRCADLLPNDSVVCAFCGCRVVEHALHTAMTPGRLKIRSDARRALRVLDAKRRGRG